MKTNISENVLKVYTKKIESQRNKNIMTSPKIQPSCKKKQH